MIRLCWVFTLMLVLPAASWAQPDQPPKYTFRVGLDVTGDSQVASEANSYLARELRALGDVAIGSEDPLYVLHAVVLQKRDMVSLTFVVHKFSDLSLLCKTCECKESLMESCVRMLEDSEKLYAVRARLGSHTELQGFCQELVASFDGEYLQDLRTKQQEVWDILKPYMK